jgi:hypothetical protein
MGKYFFDANNGRRWLCDLEGTELSCPASAVVRGRCVVRELMRNDDGEKLHWRLRVRNENQDVVEEIPFASLQERPRNPAQQQLAKALCSLSTTMQETEHIGRQLMATLRRAEQKPYLAAVSGRKVIE